MVKISITIGELHPAIVSAVKVIGACPVKVLARINSEIELAQGPESKVEFSGDIRSKETKGHVSISATGKMKGAQFNKDSAAGLLARVNWYLEGSKELYTRIETVTLPNSVKTWLQSKDLRDAGLVQGHKVAEETATA